MSITRSLACLAQFKFGKRVCLLAPHCFFTLGQFLNLVLLVQQQLSGQSLLPLLDRIHSGLSLLSNIAMLSWQFLLMLHCRPRLFLGNCLIRTQIASQPHLFIFYCLLIRQ